MIKYEVLVSFCGIDAVTTEAGQLTAQPSGDGARRRKRKSGNPRGSPGRPFARTRVPTEKVREIREDESEEETTRSCLT